MVLLKNETIFNDIKLEKNDIADFGTTKPDFTEFGTTKPDILKFGTTKHWLSEYGTTNSYTFEIEKGKMDDDNQFLDFLKSSFGVLTREWKMIFKLPDRRKSLGRDLNPIQITIFFYWGLFPICITVTAPRSQNFKFQFQIPE